LRAFHLKKWGENIRKIPKRQNLIAASKLTNLLYCLSSIFLSIDTFKWKFWNWFAKQYKNLGSLIPSFERGKTVSKKSSVREFVIWTWRLVSFELYISLMQCLCQMYFNPQLVFLISKLWKNSFGTKVLGKSNSLLEEKKSDYNSFFEILIRKFWSFSVGDLYPRITWNFLKISYGINSVSSNVIWGFPTFVWKGFPTLSWTL